MSHEEEKRCPLCAEEMDWTDQQFKPCKCGYQVCVWCWHHIMDMAEKDETEGRCPACRTIYEKEKIVALQANCERAATNNLNRKSKPPKAKPKANDVKKDLTNVRVIQRKMAYVIGLPLSLADEDLLQRKDYFGQYGKVTKISLSRTAGGAIQQFVNDSCSVYVTFSKEEEAIRCIQSVHGYVLDGRYLRASFGTAKYCHAWLRNMPCNNPGCLYLHSIGADEDSFGKDEVAAVHTRNRVQQIVGDQNNMLRRSGNVLPPPLDEYPNTISSPTDKATVRSSLTSNLDPAHATVNSSCHISNLLQSKCRDGGVEAPNKMTTFVDIVGRPNSSGLEKGGNIAEDKRIVDLYSGLSSVTLDKEIHAPEPHSDSMLFRVSSSNHLLNGLSGDEESNYFSEDSFREDIRSFNVQGSNNPNVLSQRPFLLPPSYPTEIVEDSSGRMSLHERSQSVSNFSMDHSPVHTQEDEVSLPITCVNSVLDDGCHEMKFQSSAKSDRIFRGSNSFSNEEIVEHLRRIDDDKLINDGENSALDVVESSIISNIMSMDFDSFDDSLTLPHNMSKTFNDANGHHGSSWHSQNSDQSGFSFVKQDVYSSQMNDVKSSFSNSGQVSSKCSLFPDFGESNQHYLYKSQFQVPKPQCVSPPGFSVPCRDPPPGFSVSERSGRFSRVPSGNHLVNTSSFPNTLLQRASTDNNGTPEVDFIDPAILSCGKSKTANGLNSSGLALRQTSAPQLSAFEDEGRFWRLMQQSKSAHEDPKFSQTFFPQSPSTHQELKYPGRSGEFSSLDDIYGLSSRLIEQRQSYEPSSFTQLSHQKFANGHILNGYQYNGDDVQLRNEVGVAELQRNERLGFNKFFPGYGDMRFQMPSSGDVYTRVFGM